MSPGKRVLIAVVDYLVSLAIKRSAENAGCAVVGTATNGQEAIALTRSLHPDIVLIDADAPEMGGLETVRQISQGGGPPVICLLDSASPEQTTAAREAGASGYVDRTATAPTICQAISDMSAEHDSCD